MRALLKRTVVRVGPELYDVVTGLCARLHAETGTKYTRASVLRGVITLGLATVNAADTLAPLFVGARVSRGRRRQDPEPEPSTQGSPP